MTNAFTHCPTRKDLRKSVLFTPATKDLWAKVWAEARKQDWFSDQVVYVANDGTRFYFQLRGLTTGYAFVTLS